LPEAHGDGLPEEYNKRCCNTGDGLLEEHGDGKSEAHVERCSNTGNGLPEPNVDALLDAEVHLILSTEPRRDLGGPNVEAWSEQLNEDNRVPGDVCLSLHTALVSVLV